MVHLLNQISPLLYEGPGSSGSGKSPVFIHIWIIFGTMTNPLSSCWPTSILLEMNQTSHIFPNDQLENKPLAPVNAAAIVSNAAPKFSQALKMHLQSAM